MPPKKDIKLVIGDYDAIVGRILEITEGFDIKREEFSELDHLAYRTESVESYEKMKKALSSFGEMVSENIVSGRPIAVLKLKKPIFSNYFDIPAIEIIAPKPNNEHKDGLEHIEFVIASSISEFMLKHKGRSFDPSDLDRKHNPVLTLDFIGCAVRFHTKSILDVVEIQKETGEL